MPRRTHPPLFLIELSERLEHLGSRPVSFKPPNISFCGLSSAPDVKDRPLSPPLAEKLDDRMSKEGSSTIRDSVRRPQEHRKPNVGCVISQLRSSVGRLHKFDGNFLFTEQLHDVHCAGGVSPSAVVQTLSFARDARQYQNIRERMAFCSQLKAVAHNPQLQVQPKHLRQPGQRPKRWSVLSRLKPSDGWLAHPELTRQGTLAEPMPSSIVNKHGGNLIGELGLLPDSSDLGISELLGQDLLVRDQLCQLTHSPPAADVPWRSPARILAGRPGPRARRPQ